MRQGACMELRHRAAARRHHHPSAPPRQAAGTACQRATRGDSRWWAGGARPAEKRVFDSCYGTRRLVAVGLGWLLLGACVDSSTAHHHFVVTHRCDHARSSARVFVFVWWRCTVTTTARAWTAKRPAVHGHTQPVHPRPSVLNLYHAAAHTVTPTVNCAVGTDQSVGEGLRPNACTAT